MPYWQDYVILRMKYLRVIAGRIKEAWLALLGKSIIPTDRKDWTVTYSNGREWDGYYSSQQQAD